MVSDFGGTAVRLAKLVTRHKQTLAVFSSRRVELKLARVGPILS
jgi:hypothetical protein